jgi:hypothetical protein
MAESARKAAIDVFTIVLLFEPSLDRGHPLSRDC